MNYYKRHLGDYAKKTGHLSALEHGQYTLILDAYYDREQAPTEADAIRWARARNPVETQMVSDLLAEFFKLRDGRYYQQRVEDELAAAKALSERNQTNGKRGGRPPRARKTQMVKSGMPEIRQSTNPLIQDLKEKAGEQTALPAWLPADAWKDWCDYKHARKGFTAKAKALSLRTLVKCHEDKHDVRKIIETAIERGWTGLFPPTERNGKPAEPIRKRVQL